MCSVSVNGLIFSNMITSFNDEDDNDDVGGGTSHQCSPYYVPSTLVNIPLVLPLLIIQRTL